MKLPHLIPLGLFGLLAVFLGMGLFLNPSEVPSPLIGKPAPEFSLPRLDNPQQLVSSRDMEGKVWMLTVWASWCVTCRQQHPLLTQFAREFDVAVYGLNYKDRREDALVWLRNFGNPFVTTVYDADGRVGMDYGVYGVPETYLIDAQGIIRYKQIGPMTASALEKKILPLIQELKAASGQGVVDDIAGI